MNGAATPPASWLIAKKNEMACPRSSSGKISLTVRYADEAPAEAKKKMTHQKMVWVVGVRAPEEKSCALIASRIADSPYVDRIIFRRPMVSNRWPSSSGPSRLPSANGKKKYP